MDNIQKPAADLQKLLTAKQATLEAAIKKGDLKTYESLLAADFALSLSQYPKLTRQQHLTELKSDKEQWFRLMSLLQSKGPQDYGLMARDAVKDLKVVPRRLEEVSIKDDQATFVFVETMTSRVLKSRMRPEHDFKMSSTARFRWTKTARGWFLQSISSEAKTFINGQEMR